MRCLTELNDTFNMRIALKSQAEFDIFIPAARGNGDGAVGGNDGAFIGHCTVLGVGSRDAIGVLAAGDDSALVGHLNAAGILTAERHTKAAVDDVNRAFVGDLGFAVFGIGGGQHAGAAFDVDRTFVNDGGCVACTCVRNHAFGRFIVVFFAVVVGVDVDDGTFGIYAFFTAAGEDAGGVLTEFVARNAVGKHPDASVVSDDVTLCRAEERGCFGAGTHRFARSDKADTIPGRLFIACRIVRIVAIDDFVVIRLICRDCGKFGGVNRCGHHSGGHGGQVKAGHLLLRLWVAKVASLHDLVLSVKRIKTVLFNSITN